MKRTYSQLDLDERRKIERWRHAGVAVDVIAEKLGRHRSTIFREIARNKFADPEMPELTGYFCVAANGKARGRRSRHRKLMRHPKLRASIIERIKPNTSPSASSWLPPSTGVPHEGGQLASNVLQPVEFRQPPTAFSLSDEGYCAAGVHLFAAKFGLTI